MDSRNVLLAVCLAFALAPMANAKVSPWIEVRSPHFRVLTNGSAADARHVAHEFEQMRYVFASRFAGLRLDSGAPMSIFAARDENTAKSLEPRIWTRKGAKPAGWFKHGWEKQYVMIDLDRHTTHLNTYALVYHEYTHSILHMNAHWLPTWLDEAWQSSTALQLYGRCCRGGRARRSFCSGQRNRKDDGGRQVIVVLTCRRGSSNARLRSPSKYRSKRSRVRRFPPAFDAGFERKLISIGRISSFRYEEVREMESQRRPYRRNSRSRRRCGSSLGMLGQPCLLSRASFSSIAALEDWHEDVPGQRDS